MIRGKIVHRKIKYFGDRLSKQAARSVFASSEDSDRTSVDQSSVSALW